MNLARLQRCRPSTTATPPGRVIGVDEVRKMRMTARKWSRFLFAGHKIAIAVVPLSVVALARPCLRTGRYLSRLRTACRSQDVANVRWGSSPGIKHFLPAVQLRAVVFRTVDSFTPAATG